jgi:hypothetical protein
MGERFFSGEYGVSREELDEYGAFDISLLTDLPLFIDPFLLFNSEKLEYKELHDGIIDYLRFLRDKSVGANLDAGLIKRLYSFHEVNQTWLGFSQASNHGLGLGVTFARALSDNLAGIFRTFGSESVTLGSHLEKLCLIGNGVGRDKISDFVTNLILGYLASFTEEFASRYIDNERTRAFAISRAKFNYGTESWVTHVYQLPFYQGDYVLLTPKDILSKDDTWINRSDVAKDYKDVVDAIPDEQLRAEINNYFEKMLPSTSREETHAQVQPTEQEKGRAIWGVARRYPELLDYYIRYKEDRGDVATSVSDQDVRDSEQLYLEQFGALALSIDRLPALDIPVDSFGAALARVQYMKNIIENNDGYRDFYVSGRPVKTEADLHILYKYTWFGSGFDVNQEVNNGRGPADFKISRGSDDKTLVEFKLATNTKLERNLQNQLRIYEAANSTKKSIEVIFFFTEKGEDRVRGIMDKLKLLESDSLVLIDARADNKPSASVATST